MKTWFYLSDSKFILQYLLIDLFIKNEQLHNTITYKTEAKHVEIEKLWYNITLATRRSKGNVKGETWKILKVQNSI